MTSRRRLGDGERDETGCRAWPRPVQAIPSEAVAIRSTLGLTEHLRLGRLRYITRACSGRNPSAPGGGFRVQAWYRALASPGVEAATGHRSLGQSVWHEEVYEEFIRSTSKVEGEALESIDDRSGKNLLSVRLLGFAQSAAG